ncbi:hypothetical protein BSKO_07378 [Bryopsis sp. KO-2023]|nr:hypothetical protein BSKO_07378 [Bryopsis sp. KO-2023]
MKQERGFEVALRHSKRVRLIDVEGKEEFFETDVWQRLGATEGARKVEDQPKKLEQTEISQENERLGDEGKAEVDSKEDGDDQVDEIPTPMEAIENLSAARGELQLVLDLIGKVEQHQEVSVPNIPDKRTHADRLGSMAKEAALRCGAKQRTLKAASSTLKGGFQALKERCRRENNFYEELAKLQGFWKIQHNPAVGSRTAFSVDLSLGRVAEQKNNPPPPAVKIDIYQDPRGKVKIQVPEEHQTLNIQTDQADARQGVGNEQEAAGAMEIDGSESDAQEEGCDGRFQQVVIVGGRAVHEYLLNRQKRIIWDLLGKTLSHQGSYSPHGGYFNALVHKVLVHTETYSDPRVATFRPFLLLRFLTHLFQTPMSSSIACQPEGSTMLTEVVEWIKHVLWSRKIVWQTIDKEVVGLDGVALHWQVTWHPYLSGLRVIVQNRFNGVLLVRGAFSELEGTLARNDGSTNHFCLRVGQNEAASLLRSIAGEATD